MAESLSIFSPRFSQLVKNVAEIRESGGFFPEKATRHASASPEKCGEIAGTAGIGGFFPESGGSFADSVGFISDFGGFVTDIGASFSEFVGFRFAAMEPGFFTTEHTEGTENREQRKTQSAQSRNHFITP